LLVFSELSITGYPPMDLLENRKLVNDNLAAAEHIAAMAQDCAIVFGFVDRDENGYLYNAAAFAADGNLSAVQHKRLLPTYDVFDEHRYFTPGRDSTVVSYMGYRIGMTICEDIWNYSGKINPVFTDNRLYSRDPVSELYNEGIDLLVNISASPFVSGKNKHKQSFLAEISRDCKVPLLYCNQVGGNDSLVFDGYSRAFNSNGATAAFAPKFEEGFCIFSGDNTPVDLPEEDTLGDIERALCLGLKDYTVKCGFSKTVIGLSGGIDSAVTAAIAVRALGAENVHGITMPSEYSSRGSVDDSILLARNLGIRIDTIPIRDIFDTYNDSLAALFTGYCPDVTEENLQARIRGTLLMALSNKFGAMLLSTGNKSELAMGYCTLYGDMNGGLAVISDLPKTTVYNLARYINRNGEIIPDNTIQKPPSAELREGQTDADSLPPYEVLDAILKEYIENRSNLNEIVAMGFDRGIVEFVLRAVDRNEYKRRQAAPGLKVTSKAFGTGRRIPIAQRFRP
ncbi:MAG: NAD+ synthase, partial [Spirochaetota bacterium]